MDETLLSASCEFDLEFRSEIRAKADFTVQSYTEPSYLIDVNLRPFLHEALAYFREKNFQICVYTAGKREYAEPILREIEKENKYFSQILYRDSCVDVRLNNSNFFLKDLKKLENCDLGKTFLVDNSLLSFTLQLDNGIPICDYTGTIEEQKNDQELVVLLDFIEEVIEEV